MKVNFKSIIMLVVIVVLVILAVSFFTEQFKDDDEVLEKIGEIN